MLDALIWMRCLSSDARKKIFIDTCSPTVRRIAAAENFAGSKVDGSPNEKSRRRQQPAAARFFAMLSG